MPNKLILFAKNLRKQSTDTERVLWQHLKAKQLGGLKFRRQQPIGNYIVDFICFERKIIIELDGSQHSRELERNRDKQRDTWFKQQGYKVLRFWDNEVLTNITGTLEKIRQESHPPLNPLPSMAGKRK